MIVIITVTKDDVDGLKETLTDSNNLSIPVRWIVIDGSQDERNRVAARLLALNHPVQYRFEEPRGIYHAMNQGLADIDDQDYCLFLNGGDRLREPNLLEEVSKVIESDDPLWFVYGTEFIVGDSSFTHRHKVVTYDALLKGKVSVCHQSVIASAQLIRRFGNFDERLKLAADYKMLLLMSRDRPPIVSSAVLSTVRLGGVSDLQCRQLAVEKENVRRELRRNRGLSLTFAREAVRCQAKLSVRRICQFVGLNPNAPQRWRHQLRK